MKKIALCCSVLLLMSTLTAQSKQDSKHPLIQNLSFTHSQVAENLYAIIGAGGFTGGNIALHITDESAIMVDDALNTVSDQLISEVTKITDKPIEYLINTHIHYDHVGNNAVFAKLGSKIVSHDRLREVMADKGALTAQGHIKVSDTAVPVISFSESMSFYLGKQQVKLIHLPKAHTDGDSIVHFIDANVIHTGDLMFNGTYPFIHKDGGGSYSGYVAAQKAILALCNDDTVIIPGHGLIANKTDLANNIAMLEATHNAVKTLHDKGASEQDIIAAEPLAEFNDTYGRGFIDSKTMIQQILADF